LRPPPFAASVCICFWGHPRSSCQFSWVCDGNRDMPRDKAAFRRAMRIATDALAHRSPDPTDGATYFVATWIPKPSWTARLTETAVIGAHRFMRH